MADLSMNVMFSNAISAEARAYIHGQLSVDGISLTSSNDQLTYKGFGTSPENIIVDITGFIGLVFASGIATKAGADAWDSLKERIKRMRERHRGGLEIEFLETDGTSLVRYVIPEAPTESEVAVDNIASDLNNLTAPDERERWWLGPPDSRWGTGLDSIEYRNRKRP
jgi:hypothetical protein